MLPDRVSNPGPLTFESGALPIALRGPALMFNNVTIVMLPSICLLSVFFYPKSAAHDVAVPYVFPYLGK